VALRAVQVGDELGPSRGRLRTLAIGGLVHDTGKLSIPDRS
jgi:HD-GYP domain-containing protein (c-di-GMP phosphodiesterase class II)